MTVGTILALVILISFLVTLILAVGSYAAYKIRESRRPRQIFQTEGEFQFFEQYMHTAEAQASRERRVAEREESGDLGYTANFPAIGKAETTDEPDDNSANKTQLM